MSVYEPNSRHLREVLIFCFNMKKSAAEAHRMLSNTYGETTISERTCREWWVSTLQEWFDDDFDVEDRHSGGREKVFEVAELEAFEQDSCQNQEELARSLGVTQQAISKRLKAMGMIQKQGNWVPYELKPRDVERRLFACEQLLERQRRKGFLHRIVTGDEKWVHYDNPKRRKSWGVPSHASTSTAKPNIHGSKVMFCIWWDQLGVVYYELLKPTEKSQAIGIERNCVERRCVCRALEDKWPQYNERHDKVILQHDNARPHVAKVIKPYLETLKWEVLPHPPYSSDVAPSDYHLFRSMAHGLADQHFRSYEKVKNWIDSCSLKRWPVFSTRDSYAIRKMGESSGQR